MSVADGADGIPVDPLAFPRLRPRKRSWKIRPAGRIRYPGVAHLPSAGTVCGISLLLLDEPYGVIESMNLELTVSSVRG